MSVQKKSLISQRSAVKAAILANPTQSVGSVPSVRPATRAASRPAARAASRPAARAAVRATVRAGK